MAKNPSVLQWLSLYGAGARSGAAGRISIETIDNPGWLVKASLAASGRPGLVVPLTGWMNASVVDGVFRARCAAGSLVPMIRTFVGFVRVGGAYRP